MVEAKHQFVRVRCPRGGLTAEMRLSDIVQVFNSLNLTAYDLSVDMLDVHAVSDTTSV